MKNKYKEGDFIDFTISNIGTFNGVFVCYLPIKQEKAPRAMVLYKGSKMCVFTCNLSTRKKIVKISYDK
jgi:hypothetical protein